MSKPNPKDLVVDLGPSQVAFPPIGPCGLLDPSQLGGSSSEGNYGWEAMEKNPKACEPCRRRKIRCDGRTPCNRCEKKPSECLYRLRTRVRKSGVHRAATAAAAAAAAAGAAAHNKPAATGTLDDGEQPAHGPASLPPAQAEVALSPSGFRKHDPENGGGPVSDTAYNNVYQSVAAAANASGREWTENSRLFYGPASQFAFLQQVHRGIISSSGPHSQQDPEVQEGGPGLDLFLQRSFFFGTASRVDTSTLLRPANQLFPAVSLEKAKTFLEKFKAWSAHILPFFTDAELDKMLQELYSSEENSRPTQTKALTLAVMALGALGTQHTNVAEMLMAKAKYEAVLFDDTVSLQMIQFSLLLADYHTGMGRPNLVYLCVGTACRKAFALGLHREAASCLTRPDDVRKFRTTLWCLYSLESWYSMTVGRESSLRMADISSPFPEDQPLLVGMSRLAHIAESTTRMIYTQRYDSLRKLYMAAETIHAQLREFADKYGIGSATEGYTPVSDDPASLMMHNLYYHTVLLTYRPFLVADYALASSPDGKIAEGGGGPMWLRQACRTAIDSAQDGILYAHNQIRKHDACRSSRYNGFFFESSCAVLFFDILRHPSKYPYNVEFINMALQSLDSMVNDEPITNARNSVRQILHVVQETISKKKSPGAAATPSIAAARRGGDILLPQQQPTDPSLPSPASFLGQEAPQSSTCAASNVHFPSLNAPEQSLIYFPDLGGNSLGAGNTIPMHGLGVDPADVNGDGLDPLLHFHYDVLATDLYSFFPLNMTPPSATTGNDAGQRALGGEAGPAG